MSFDASTIAMLKTGIWETVYMTMLSSFLAYVIGLPLGVILVVTDEGGFYPIPWLQKILGLVINLLRSVPFLILLFIVLPLSKIVIGTRIGSPAMIIPLTIAAAPYVARVVESSFREIDAGVIEAAKSMGASTWQIIWKVLLPECKPSLLVGAALAVTTILSYSAMAGFTGGGGLGGGVCGPQPGQKDRNHYAVRESEGLYPAGIEGARGEQCFLRHRPCLSGR